MNNELIIAIVGIIGTLVGTWIGSYSTNKGQEKLFNLQLGAEEEKLNKDIIRQRMEIYSEFKYVNGSISIYGETPDIQFNIELYIEKISPIFNKKFYLLPKELKKHINNIDEEISWMLLYMETSNYDKDIIGENYSAIYRIINDELMEYEV